MEALNKAADAADDTTIAFIQALADDAVKTQGDACWWCEMAGRKTRSQALSKRCQQMQTT